MPTYAYRCKNCSHEFEELQRISEPPLTLCPVCGKDALVRMISGGAGLVFKGSGVYQTDYKKSSASGSGEKNPSPKDNKKDFSQESKGEAKQESRGEGKHESKGEGKQESKAEKKASESDSKKPAADPAPSPYPPGRPG